MRENDPITGITKVWEYDDAGNIKSRTEYAYTTGALGAPIDTTNYSYVDSEWGDLLTGYGSVAFSYDGIGNLTNDGTWIYTWQHGRELASMSDGIDDWEFTYDANGMRTRRTNGTATYEYTYNGSQLAYMKKGYETLSFIYGANGPAIVFYNQLPYFYVTNLQGDVIGITSHMGNLVVSYTYDAWGNVTSVTGSMAATLGQTNPLRYRGYVYDQETGLYYLQSRYYNPEIGRFINADVFVSTGQGLLGNNMFAYCLNNPINFIDRSGDSAEALQWWASTMWWLCGADTALPLGDIIYGTGVLILGVYALTAADEVITPQISLVEENSSVYEYREHTKGARQSTKGRHQKGKTRKNRDNRGEKGDARRYYIGNKKKLRMFFLIAGDLFYEDESTQVVTSGELTASGFGGRGTHSFFALHMLY